MWASTWPVVWKRLSGYRPWRRGPTWGYGLRPQGWKVGRGPASSISTMRMLGASGEGGAAQRAACRRIPAWCGRRCSPMVWVEKEGTPGCMLFFSSVLIFFSSHLVTLLAYLRLPPHAPVTSGSSPHSLSALLDCGTATSPHAKSCPDRRRTCVPRCRRCYRQGPFDRSRHSG